MEALFTQVSEKHQPAHREVLVYHNRKNDKISLQIKDFKSAWNKVGLTKTTIDTYLADLKTEARCTTTQFRIDDFASGKHIDLIVEYLVQLNEHEVEKGLESFLRSRDLEPVFNDYIKALTKDFSREHPLIDAPDSLASELQQYLRSQLRSFEPGYLVTCRVKVVDFIPDKEQINSEGLKVRFKGGKGEIKLHFNAEVAVDRLNRDAARQSSLRDKAQLRVHLQELVRSYFVAEVEQERFFDRRYRRSILTEDLEDHLNRELRPHGRKLVFFEFNENLLREHSAPEGLSALPVQVACQVRHASKFVSLDVSTKVTMELADEGQAIMSGISTSGSLKAWAIKNIKEIVETTFLEQEDFADVVIAFFDGNNTIEKAIGDELGIRARTIGYDLKYYNVLPNLEKFENRQVTVNEQGVEFKTKGGDIPLSLSFEIEGTIQKWGEVKKFLRPEQDNDLRREIGDKAKAAIKEVLLENYAERLYMHFYEPYEGKPSVEKELYHKISEAISEFKLDDLKIRLIPAESDIKSRFAKVLNKIKRVTVVFKSLRKDSMPEDLVYHFSYRIIGIDRENAGFNVFYSSKDLEVQYWMGQIAERLKTTLITFLNTLETQLVKYDREDVRRKLEEIFQYQYAVPEIKRAFGMDIDIHEFRRDLTERETVDSKTASHLISKKGESDRERINREFAALLDEGKEEKRTIEKRLNELYQYGVFKTEEQEAELKRLEARLKKLNKKNESVIDSFESRFTQDASTDIDPLTLLESKEQQLLGEGKKAKREDDASDTDAQ